LSREEIHEELVNSVLSFDSRKVVQTSKKALEARLDPTDVIENGLARGLGIIGKKFEDGELFLMDLVAAAEAVKKAMTEVLEPELVNLKAERRTRGRVVIGTVAGDIHDIGKNIVATMLFAAGFEVRDLGTDVPAQDFVNKSKEVNPIIVGLSALLSTTLPIQREAVQGFCTEGMRDRVKIMVGGAPVTEEWAREIGADGYGENAAAAVRLANNLVGVQ
jgi:corrinoid protein of di/trimethylamine methyltransferase